MALNDNSQFNADGAGSNDHQAGWLRALAMGALGLLPAGMAQVIGARYMAVQPTYTTGQATELQADAKGSLNVTLRAQDSSFSPTTTSAPLDQSSATPVAVIRSQSYGFEFNGATWDRHRKPHRYHRLLASAASDNATLIRAGYQDLHKIVGVNKKAASVFLKFYDKVTAPVVGDTPVMTFELLASQPFAIDLDGHYFALGLGYRLTLAAADADVTALVAGDITCLNVTHAGA